MSNKLGSYAVTALWREQRRGVIVYRNRAVHMPVLRYSEHLLRYLTIHGRINPRPRLRGVAE